MQALIGIDLSNEPSGALRLLSRMELESLQVELLHAVEPRIPLAAYEAVPSGAAESEYFDASRTAGETALDREMADAKDLDVTSRRTLVFGSPATHLLAHGEEGRFDMIGVHHRDRSLVEALVTGSVSRAITLSFVRSVLVAKGHVEPKGKLRAVVGIDHSAYGLECLERLIAWKPGGFEKVLVTTSYAVNDREAAMLNINLAKLGANVEEWMTEKISAKCQVVADRLTSHGVPSDVLVGHGKPQEFLAKAMRDFNADVLILGAQGHGLMERLLIGSVSLHHVMSGHYSVMVLRA